MENYQIGGITFDTPYFMAPLAGITDSPFRRLCRRFGAGAVYSEMISAKGLYYNDKATEKLLTICEEEMPVVYQTVSYTHLDVYKRQVEDRQRRSWTADPL